MIPPLGFDRAVKCYGLTFRGIEQVNVRIHVVDARKQETEKNTPTKREPETSRDR